MYRKGDTPPMGGCLPAARLHRQPAKGATDGLHAGCEVAVYQPGRLSPHLPQKTSRIGPFSLLHFSHFQDIPLTSLSISISNRMYFKVSGMSISTPEWVTVTPGS